MIKKILKYTLGAIVLLGVLGALFGGGGANQPSSKSSAPAKQVEPAKPIEYATADVATMMQDLENNAAAAQKRYKGQYLKVSGMLGTIDSDMKYISIIPDEYSILGVHCTLKRNDKAQENFVMNLSKKQWVTAYGKITDVGEVMGYTMAVDKFE